MLYIEYYTQQPGDIPRLCNLGTRKYLKYSTVLSDVFTMMRNNKYVKEIHIMENGTLLRSFELQSQGWIDTYISERRIEEIQFQTAMKSRG
jgi:hypothetical protein